jgi:outer membrane protein OmpA-like peptidoglycan-associated protein
VNYTLRGDEIQAIADIVLSDLRVGEKTSDDFQRRIGIPLELAIALLQDINGVIRLQSALGTEGTRVDFSNLLWNAVRNAFIGAITAPFRLVGKILTFGGRIRQIRIQPILFEPGTREIASPSAKQLGDLANLLKEKPQIELNLSGRASEDEIETIKKKKFWERIQRAEGEGYEEALIRVYREMGGITKPTAPLAPIAEESLERFVTERIEITEKELRALARDRAEIVKDELQKRGVDPERLVVSGGKALAPDNAAAVEIELLS